MLLPGAQVLGAMIGACLQVYLVPGFAFGQWADTTCHVPGKGVDGLQLFIWEVRAGAAWQLGRCLTLLGQGRDDCQQPVSGASNKGSIPPPPPAHSRTRHAQPACLPAHT